MLLFKEKLLALFGNFNFVIAFMIMSFASQTPIHVLPGIGPRTAAVLHRLGVHTAGQFSSIPENVLIELFGPSIRAVTSVVTSRQYSPSFTQTQSTYHDHQKELHDEHRKKPFFRKLHVAMNFLAML